MNERDVRLLAQANHWCGASIKYAPNENGWLVELQVNDDTQPQALTLKRGKPRIFKTSDTALAWCRDIGLNKIKVHLHKFAPNEKINEEHVPNILLVEDNANDIDLTLRAIQRLDFNFNMEVCRDGEEALDFLFANGKYNQRDTEELPRLILLDLKLPRLDGIQVLKQIRANTQTKYLPVVILTTSDEINDIDEGYKLGINSFVRKPVDFEVFCDTIKELGHYWLKTNTPPLHLSS
jgi:two-component system response regulator